MLHQGKVKTLMADHPELAYIEADKIMLAAHGIRHGHEADVLAYVAETLNNSEAWKSALPATNRERLLWEAEWDMPRCKLSCPGGLRFVTL